MIDFIINEFSNITPLGHVFISILIVFFILFVMRDISKSKSKARQFMGAFGLIISIIVFALVAVFFVHVFTE